MSLVNIRIRSRIRIRTRCRTCKALGIRIINSNRINSIRIVILTIIRTASIRSRRNANTHIIVKQYW